MTPFVIEAWLLAKLSADDTSRDMPVISKQRVPIPLDKDDTRYQLQKTGDELILGRGPSNGNQHAAIPESSGFGRAMPSRALILALRRDRSGAPCVMATSEPTQPDSWRLLIGSTAVKAGSPPRPVQAGETVTLQHETYDREWVNIVAATVTSGPPGPLDATEDPKQEAVTDPAPISALRAEAATLVHDALFGKDPEEWGHWAKAIAALSCFYQRPDLFAAHPYLKLAARGNWMDSVTRAMGRTHTDFKQYTTPSHILPRLSEPLERLSGPLESTDFDDVFNLPSWRDGERASWLSQLTALLAERGIVTQDVFEIVTLNFDEAERIEKKRLLGNQ